METLRYKCPGFEIDFGEFSGCDSTRGADCPVCNGTGYIINCPCCGKHVKSDGTCEDGCWYPLEGEKR